MFDLPPPTLPPASALEYIVDSPYGFCFVDIGITEDDFNMLDNLDIQKDDDYNRFGTLDNLEAEVGAFLKTIGSNDDPTVENIARLINRIATDILSLSGRECAWVFLRARTPNHLFDVPQWHIDTLFSLPKRDVFEYKFSLTLKGPSTLFYPILKSDSAFRRFIRINLVSRELMNEACPVDRAISPPTGLGTFFIAGEKLDSVLHSKPPMHSQRLFLSITPCHEKALELLKDGVLKYYSLY